MAHGFISPVSGSHERVDTICPDYHVRLDRLLVRKLDSNLTSFVHKSGCPVIQSQHPRRKGVEHSLIQSPTQQADESAAILFFNLRRQAYIRTEAAIGSLEVRVTRCPEIVRIDTDDS